MLHIYNLVRFPCHASYDPLSLRNSKSLLSKLSPPYSVRITPLNMAEKISYEPLIQDDTTMAMVNSSPSNRFTRSGVFTNRPAVLSALIIILVMSLTANTLQFLHAFKTATAGGLSNH